MTRVVVEQLRQLANTFAKGLGRSGNRTGQRILRRLNLRLRRGCISGSACLCRLHIRVIQKQRWTKLQDSLQGVHQIGAKGLFPFPLAPTITNTPQGFMFKVEIQHIQFIKVPIRVDAILADLFGKTVV